MKSKYDLDDPRRTMEHRELILEKKFLKRIYVDWYKELVSEAGNCPPGTKIEIGSGGGFFKDIYPEVITSDILQLPIVDQVFSAEEIPYDQGEVSAYFMVNVFHHIPDVRKFLSEAMRTLKKGGKIIMIEPANSPFSSFIYRFFHHELFDKSRPDWSFPQTGPLSGSNSALPYIVFTRDRKIFEKEFPGLKIEKLRKHTGFRYLLSGGVSKPQLMPFAAYNFIRWAEDLFPGLTGMFETIVVVRT